jgi:hypothetical protein
VLRLTSIVLIASSMGSAAQFTSTALCNAYRVSSAGDAACDARDTYDGSSVLIGRQQFATASITGNSFTITGNTITVEEQVHTYVSALGEASAHDAFSGQLFTQGPNRSGIVKGEFDTNVSRYSGGASFSVSYPNELFTSSFGPNRPLPPIELGALFPLSVITDVHVTSDDLTNAYVDTGLRLQLSFFELDGVTPVNVAEISVGTVPEPVSIYLTLGSLIGAFLLRRRASV